jgi:hypothetical protein
MRMYNVQQTTDGEVLFPYYNKAGEFVAYKVRNPEKSFKVEGDWKCNVVWSTGIPKGGKVVTCVRVR